MYKTRILPVDEWHKLVGTEPGLAYEHFDPTLTSVMVVERDDVIVGTWCLMPYYHAECVWIAEAHRGNSAVVKRLIVGMRQMAHEVGVNAVITSALDEKTVKLLEHLEAEKLPGEQYVIKFRG